MLSNEWILNNKISGIKLFFSLYATIKMMHGPINIRFTCITLVWNAICRAAIFQHGDDMEFWGYVRTI